MSIAGGFYFENNIVWANSKSTSSNDSGGKPRDDISSANPIKWSILSNGATFDSTSGNIAQDPLLSENLDGPPSLSPNSPAINAGNPLCKKDPDGSRADIGWKADRENLSNFTVYYPPSSEIFELKVLEGESLDFQFIASSGEGENLTHKINGGRDAPFFKIIEESGLLTLSNSISYQIPNQHHDNYYQVEVQYIQLFWILGGPVT